MLASRPGIASIIFRDALLRNVAQSGRLGGHDAAIVAGMILGAWIQTAEAIIASNPEETLRAGQAALSALLSGLTSELS